jgi:WD repeat-containing protein 26
LIRSFESNRPSSHTAPPDLYTRHTIPFTPATLLIAFLRTFPVFKKSIAGGQTATVVLASEPPQDPNAPFIPDYPSTSTSSILTSQVLSAQQPAISAISLPPIQTLSDTQNTDPITSAPTQGLVAGTPTPLLSSTLPPSRRRRRSSSSRSSSPSTVAPGPTEEVSEDWQDNSASHHEQSSNYNRRDRKRRRVDTMRYEAETSNNPGSSGLSNGSHSALNKNGVNGSGHATVSNGVSPHTNGSSHNPTPRPTYHGHDREEVARIMIQSLKDMGYTAAASALIKESGYELESPSVATFRTSVLQGNWAEAEKILFGDSVGSHSNGTTNGKSASRPGLRLSDEADPNEMLYRLREQKFLELLEERELGSALKVLRMELTPLNPDNGSRNGLSRYTCIT